MVMRLRLVGKVRGPHTINFQHLVKFMLMRLSSSEMSDL